MSGPVHFSSAQQFRVMMISSGLTFWVRIIQNLFCDKQTFKLNSLPNINIGVYIFYE